MALVSALGYLWIRRVRDRSGQEHAVSQVDHSSELIRAVLSEHGRLPVDVEGLSDDSDLYRAGMTSHASVNLMLALEDAFDLEFPDHMLRRSVFASIASIHAAIDEIRAGAGT